MELRYPIEDTTQCDELARRVRHHALLMVNRAKSSHIGSIFSMVELLAVLYGDCVHWL